MQQTARKKRKLNGVLLFDKPLELSSNTALQKVRWLYAAEKAGHTGTLDPLATGLLPVCFGEATKFTAGLLDADKSYRARVKLGAVSTTGDAEGEITVTGGRLPTEDEARAAILKFTGEIMQRPPMHSALKHQGRPLYEYVRKGETVEREARPVTIYELALEDFSGDEMTIFVRCSKGTYIRTLAEDIGAALACGAHLIALRRTGIANFRLEDAHTWEELNAMDEGRRDALLLPLDLLVMNLPEVRLSAEEAARVALGQRLALNTNLPDGKVRLYGDKGFMGLAEIAGRRLSPVRLLSI
jgi:tRNA pseudouridine55 synthase